MKVNMLSYPDSRFAGEGGHMPLTKPLWDIYYGVALGDGGKDILVRGVWIKNRGLFTLG